MTLRSRLALPPAALPDLRQVAGREYPELRAQRPARVAKVFGPGVPAPVEVSEAQQEMTWDSPFSPGLPIGPYDGFNRQPRTQDFVPGYNIATRPRPYERISFEVLRGLIDTYDVAQMCLWHRIDSMRSVKLRLLPAEGYSGDVTGAIDIATSVLRSPDRQHGFGAWFAKWMYDVLAYDAGTLYRLRNRAGKVIGLMPIDGTTIAPLLDYWGNSPKAPAEAYVQFIQGLPWNWLTRDDIIYQPFRPRNNSPYGIPPIETVLLNANTDVRFQLYFLQRFTEGNIPGAFASSPDTWTPDQIENWQTYWDSFMYADQTRKSQIRWMPGGTGITWSDEKEFTDAFSLFLMRKTAAAFHIVPTDLGFTENSNYSTGESQADVGHKVGELPLMEFSEDILSRFLYDDLELPLRAEWDRGEDQDDRLVQAQADQIYLQNAVVGADELREMRFGLPYDADRPVPRMFFTAKSGPVPLNAVLAVSGEIDPETAAPAPGAPLPHMAFGGVPGVIPNPPVVEAPLAVDEFGPKALPPMPPQQPMPPGAPGSGGGGGGAQDGGKPEGKPAPKTGAKPKAGATPKAAAKPKPKAAPKGNAKPQPKNVKKAESAGIDAGTGIYGDPLDHDPEGSVAQPKARSRKKAARHAGRHRTAVVKARKDAGTPKTMGDYVFHQLTEDYPAAALGWVLKARWDAPAIIPFADLDMHDESSWRAFREPERVASFAAKIKKRLAKGKDQLKKPAVVVFPPGASKGIIIDGHHRTLGAREAGQHGVLAWKGHVSRGHGPWMELHDRQFTQPHSSEPHAGDDLAADQVGKCAAGATAAPLGKVKAVKRGLVPGQEKDARGRFGHVKEPGKAPEKAAGAAGKEDVPRKLSLSQGTRDKISAVRASLPKTHGEWDLLGSARDANGAVTASPKVREHLNAVLSAGDAVHGELAQALAGDDVWTAAEAAGDKVAMRRREQQVLKELLASARPFGGAHHQDVSLHSGFAAGIAVSPPGHAAREQLAQAEGFFPDSWVEKSARRPLTLASSPRAFYQPRGDGSGMLALPSSSGPYDGAFATAGDEVTVHELGHRMEQHVPGLTHLEHAYVTSRATDPSGTLEKRKSLRDLYGGGYDPSEMTLEDQWADAYAGKTYDGTPSSSWEVFQVGLQDTFGRGSRRFGGTGLQHFTLGALAALG